MWFNSLTFLIYFPIVLACFKLLRSWTSRKLALLLASYLFYAAWNPPFVLLLLASTLVDWYCARWIHAFPGRKKLWLMLSLCSNLGILAYFKYGGFLWDNATGLVQWFGFGFTPARADILLPAGISFYTFQTLSYTVDVYRGRAKPSNSILDFALYVTFFPQLVAGPIVRATEFLPQCQTPKTVTANRLGWGLALATLGLFQKVVLADGFFAPAAEAVFSRFGGLTFDQAWLGVFAFTGQIYCDFAGYSLAAVGLAQCLGFELPYNFQAPYAARGFSDFWRRWHVSLSSWLRDYLYIPLGGNRGGWVQTYRNLMLTMLLGGLWHGASWTFVAWGGMHGGLLILERRFGPRVDALSAGGGWGPAAAQWLLTFLLVCVTWVFFRSRTFAQAFVILEAMAGLGEAGRTHPLSPLQAAEVLVLLSAMLGFQFALRNRSLESLVSSTPAWGRALALAGMLVAMVISPGEDRAFIYFQF